MGDWLKEFGRFVETRQVAPPGEVSRSLLGEIHQRLNPPFSVVFGKLLLSHFVAGLVVLTICPQLGVGPFLGGHGVMALFMPLGPVICSALCGALFLGASLLFASLCLKREELRRARELEWAHVSLLMALSLMALMVAGAQRQALYLAFWAIGALGGGWLCLQLGSILRRKYLIGW